MADDEFLSDDDYVAPPMKIVSTHEVCPVGTMARIRELEAALDTLEENRARAYMRLQCADVPRDPWHWEVSEILSHSGANAPSLAPKEPTDG